MANRGWEYPLGEDPMSVDPPVLGEDYFGDEIIEGDEYWEINGADVLEDNLRNFIDKEFELKEIEEEDGETYLYWDIEGELIPDGEELNYVMDNFEMEVAKKPERDWDAERDRMLYDF